MRIWTVFILIIIIYQTHVFTAPLADSVNAVQGVLKTKFGKIADQIIDPQWTLIDPNSKKKKNDSNPSNTTVNPNDENQPMTNDQPDTNNNDKKRRPKKNIKRRRRISNIKKKRNKRNQRNIRYNGRHRWYKMVTVDYLRGNLPEYRNHEDEQNIVLIWDDGDERKIVLNEHVDALSVKNLNNNQLIRKKRDLNNTFQLQENLQAKNVNQDLKENEKDKLKIKVNTNNHRKEPEIENIQLENKQNVKKMKSYKNIDQYRGKNSFEKELSLVDNLDDDDNSMDSYSFEKSNENKNFNKNKFQHIVKNQKHPTNNFRNNLRRPNHAQKLGKTSGKNYSEMEKLRLKPVKQEPDSLKNMPTISKDVPEFNIKRNADTAKNILELNEIDTIISATNSNTDENLSDQNNELYQSSLETKLEIPNYSEIEENKEHDLFNNIIHTEKSKSKKKGNQQSDDDEKLKNTHKQNLEKPLEGNNNHKTGSNEQNIKTNTPNTKDILILSYDEPEIMTQVNNKITENTPEPDEIDTIMGAINSKSDENLDDRDNGSYNPSSLETNQEIPNYSDIEDIKEHDILNNIKYPSTPNSKKLRKTQSDGNDKLPKTFKPKLATKLEEKSNIVEETPHKPGEPLASSSKNTPRKSNDLKNSTQKGNDEIATNIPEPDEIDTIMDAINSKSDENLDDRDNGSYYPSSLETNQEIPNYSDIEDIKEHDILNNIKYPSTPNSKKLRKTQSDGNDKLPKTFKPKLATKLEAKSNIVKESPQKPGEIDLIMNDMNSTSDENLDDLTNESYPSPLEIKGEIPKHRDFEDDKKHKILNKIINPTTPNSKNLGKKQSDDNDKRPTTYKTKLNTPLNENNKIVKESLQKPVKPLETSSKKIPMKSNDIRITTTKGENDEIDKNIPKPDEIDLIMNDMKSNSDENLDDLTNESYPSPMEIKGEIPKHRDFGDDKKRKILNKIINPTTPDSKSLGKKQSDDNDKGPKTYKPKLPTPLEAKNNSVKEPLQKPVEPIETNSKKIPMKSNDIQKTTPRGENDERAKNIPEPDEIDLIMNDMNSQSDENLDDLINESYPSPLEMKGEIPKHVVFEDDKIHDILNPIKNPSISKSTEVELKQSKDNDNLPKTNKLTLATPVEAKNKTVKQSPQKPVKPFETSSKKIPMISNDIRKTTKGKNDEIAKNTPEPEEIDLIMNDINSNSDENLDDLTNESYPSPLEIKGEIPKHRDFGDDKKLKILNKIINPTTPDSKSLGKKQSDDNDKRPKTYKPKLATPLEAKNKSVKEPLQKPVEPIETNSKKIPMKSNDIQKTTPREENDERAKNIPEPDEIDLIMNDMNSKSDENLDDLINESYPSPLEMKGEIPKHVVFEDDKIHDILNPTKNPSISKSTEVELKQSKDNDNLPKTNKLTLATPVEAKNKTVKQSPQKPVKPLETSSKKIPMKSNDIRKTTKGKNDEIAKNTPEPEEMDLIMNDINSNSDENLDDLTNETYPSPLEIKGEIPKHRDFKDDKKHKILNKIINPTTPDSKSLGKKQSDDNDKRPKTYKPKLATPLEAKNKSVKEPLQKPVEPIETNSKKIPMKSNDIQKTTPREENDERAKNIPEPDEIDLIMNDMNSKSDENLDDLINESYPSPLEMKGEIPKHVVFEDDKIHDILNPTKNPSISKSTEVELKQSKDNDNLPKTNKLTLATPVEAKNKTVKQSPQKPVKPLETSSKKIPMKSNDIRKTTKGKNDEIAKNTPEPEEIDLFMNDMISKSDENLDDLINESYPSPLEMKGEIPKDIVFEDDKIHDILNIIKNPSTSKSTEVELKQSKDNDNMPKTNKLTLATPVEANNKIVKEFLEKPGKPIEPNSKKIPMKANDIQKTTKGENDEIAKNIPEPDEIDLIMNDMNSKSDENLNDLLNESYPSPLEMKGEIPKHVVFEDDKIHDILNPTKNPSISKLTEVELKQSKDNDNLPKTNKLTLATPVEAKNKTVKQSPQKPVKPLETSSKKIPMKSNDIRKTTKGKNDEIAKNTPEPEEIDLIMNDINSNSDENLDDLTNESYPSPLEIKGEIPKHRDFKDDKKHKILNKIINPTTPDSKSLGKKQSDDNDKRPKTYKPKLATLLEAKNKSVKEPLQKPVEPIETNSKKIPMKSNDIQKTTPREENDERAKNIPEPDEIDLIMNYMNSKSDENLNDLLNESNPSPLEMKGEIPKHVVFEDDKIHDILNPTKNPSISKSTEVELKQSKDNDNLPKTNKLTLATPVEAKNKTVKQSPQKPVKPLETSSKKIPMKSNDIRKTTKGKNDEIAKNTPEPEEIDLFMNDMISKSDENLDDLINESYPSPLEMKGEIPKDIVFEDDKIHDILNIIKNPSTSKSTEVELKQSKDNDNMPKTNKLTLATPVEANNKIVKEFLEKPGKPIEPNSKKIPMKANDIQKTTKGENDEIAKNIPEPDEIDLIMNDMNSKSDEKIEDLINGSYPYSLEMKGEIPKDIVFEDDKIHDILNNIKNPSISKSTEVELEQSKDNDNVPKTNKLTLTTPVEANNKIVKEFLEKPGKPIEPNSKKIPMKANDIQKTTKGENDEIAKNTTEPDETDLVMNAMKSNSEEKLEDLINGSYPYSLEMKGEIPKDIVFEDDKIHDILNNIKNPSITKSTEVELKQSKDNDNVPKTNKLTLATPVEANNKIVKEFLEKPGKPIEPNSKKKPMKANDIQKTTKVENDEIAKNTPEPDETDLVMNAMKSNSEEKLEDLINGSYPYSLEMKGEIPKDIVFEDDKIHDILNNIKNPSISKSTEVELEQSKDNDNVPKTNKLTLASPVEANNKIVKEFLEKPGKPIEPNSKKIPMKANDIQKTTKGENDEIAKNTTEPDENDLVMNAMKSNSEEKLEDLINGSYPYSLEMKGEIPKDIVFEDDKIHDILNNIKNPSITKSTEVELKQSKDNDNVPKTNKLTLATPVEANNKIVKEFLEKPGKPIEPNSKKKPMKANDIQKTTKVENDEIAKNTPEPDETDLVMNAMKSNSEEKLEDLINGSYPYSLEMKGEIPKDIVFEDDKIHDILNNIKNPSISKSTEVELEQSKDNDNVPKTNKLTLASPVEANNKIVKEFLEKPGKPIEPNSKKIPMKANDIQKTTKGENDEIAKNTTEPDENDLVMNAMKSNSEEKLEDLIKGSYPYSLEMKGEIPKDIVFEDDKIHDILNNIKNPSITKSTEVELKQSKDNDNVPKTNKLTLATPVEANNKIVKEFLEKSGKPIEPNSKKIPMKANDIQKTTKGENDEIAKNTTEPDETDLVMNAMKSNSDEKIEDLINGSYPYSLEMKGEIPKDIVYEDDKIHDVLSCIKNPSISKSTDVELKQSKDSNIVAKDSFHKNSHSPNVTKKLDHETVPISNYDLLDGIGGEQLPKTDIYDVAIIPEARNDDSSKNSNDDNLKSIHSNDDSKPIILEKNGSMKESKPVSYIKLSHLNEETNLTTNKTPNNYNDVLSKDRHSNDFEFYPNDKSSSRMPTMEALPVGLGVEAQSGITLPAVEDLYKNNNQENNLGGMTLEDNDLKNTEDQSLNITDKKDDNLPEMNKSIPNIINDTIKSKIRESINTPNVSDDIPDDKLAYINDLLNEKAEDEKPSDKSIIVVPTMDKIPKSGKGLSNDETFDNNNNMDADSILHIISQPNPFESKTGIPISDVDAINGKSVNIPIPSIPKDDKDKTEVKSPNRIINQNKMLTGNYKVSPTNKQEKIFPEISENEFNISNPAQYGFHPNSLNSKASMPDKHLLKTNKEEHLSVVNGIDKHKNSLLDDNEEINVSRGREDKPIMDYSKDLSQNQNKNIPFNLVKKQNKEFIRTAPNTDHTKYENLKELEKTKLNNDSFLLANDNPKVKINDGFDKNYDNSNHCNKFTKIINENSNNYHYQSTMDTSEENSPIISDYNLMNEDDNLYGDMLPKFSTKYIEGGDSNNLWEIVPPKKNNDFNIDNKSDRWNKDINQSVSFTKDKIISNHVNNDKKIVVKSETVKNSCDDKGNTDIYSKMSDDFIKKMSEQLFKRIDNIDDKISKFDKLSNNSSYITHNYNIRSDDPGTKKNILMNDLPIGKPKNENNIEEPDSKINKSVESHETIINNKGSDGNEIKESTKPKKDKHKKHKRHNKKHKKHSKQDRLNKKKSHKKNDRTYDDDDDNDEEYDNYDDDDDDDREHKKKIHKKNYKKNDDDKHKKNKSRKKNKIIDNDVDDRVKKISRNKNYINDDNVEVSRSKKTDNKKKKKIKENISPRESNEVNNSSCQSNSEDNDSVKGLKIKSKSKNFKKTNSTKSKKLSPKKKSKHMEHSKSIKYKNKDIPVDVSDEDSNENENNYNLDKTYVKTGRNNLPKEKTYKHKKHEKPLKTRKTFKYKEIPVDNEDEISDENNVNLEKTYNINITNDDNAVKQKRLRHKRLKKMKNIDINIVKDTDNQVLNRDIDTRLGYRFYTFQYRYPNPLARLFF